MKTLTFNAGQIIFNQGDYSASMYNILKGKVGVYSDYETEQVKELSQLGENELLGEMGMLEVYPRSATAVALEDGTVLEEIGEAELSEFFKDRPEQLLKILKQLSHRIRVVDQKYINACRAVYENAEAESSGNSKSEWLRDQIEVICNEYEAM